MLGEGGAALVLEDWQHAVARGAPILAELAGYGASSDHSHLVRPEVGGQVRALEMALADAGLQPGDIDYINAHGTATPEGDPTEIEALRRVFGEHAAALAGQRHQVDARPHDGRLGRHRGRHHRPGPARRTPCRRRPISTSSIPACTGVRHIVGEALRGTGARVALSNSFAFGGSNAVLAIRTDRNDATI